MLLVRNMIVGKTKFEVLFAGLLFVLLFIASAHGQQSEQDSLRKVLDKNPLEDTLKVMQLNKLANSNFSYNVRELTEYSQKALFLAKKLHYKRGEALAYKNLAAAYMLIHGDIRALKYQTSALRIFTNLQDTVNIANVTNGIGCFYATVKDFRQALPYFFKAAKLMTNRNDKLRLTIMSNIGSCYEDLRQYHKAKLYYDQIKILASGSKDYDRALISLYQSASLHLLAHEDDIALKYGNEALMFMVQHKVSPRSEQTIYQLMGDIRYQLKQYAQSREFYEKVKALATQMNSRENMAAVYYKFHQLDSISGNHAEALRNFKRYQVIKDSVINRNKNEIIALYKVKFEVEQKEARNRQLVMENKAEGRIIFYQSIILGVVMLSLIIIGFAFFRLKKLIFTLKDLNHKIATQNAELEELNGIKNKIFSVIAHDLRSPFTQLIGVLKLVDSEAIEANEIVDYIPFLNKSVHQTLNMTDNLLVWSKSQMDGFQVHPVTIDLPQMIEDTVEKLQPQIDAKKLVVDTAQLRASFAWADQEMIRIVLRNLISNAIKFTDANGKIEIESFSENASVVIAIRDTGVGIPSEQLDKLFSFDVKSTQGTANEAGTGLGLKICFDLLELNSGNIWVESIAGEGSIFYLSIPENVSEHATADVPAH